MAQPVTVESDALRLDVWPQFGGKVSSAVDKADGFELLFNYPAELPSGPQYDIPYGKSWYAGWDECFPAVAAGAYDRHPYNGIAVPDHGELWGLPTISVPAKGGITTVWHGLRFGYRLTRKLSLDPDAPALTAEYTLVNLAPFEFRFVCAMHALMAMNTAVEFFWPDRPFRLSHDANGADIQRVFTFGESEPQDLANLDHPSGLPAGGGWKLFSMDPIDAPFVVGYPARDSNRRLSIAYGSTDDLP